MDLEMTVRRTWCGRTEARLVGRAAGRTVDVTVTGWRRASVLAEARATFEAVSADPARPFPRKGHPMLRALLLAALLLVGLPTVAGTPGHHTFNDDAPLDASQVVDGRGVHGTAVCADDSDDCWIVYHPTRWS